MKVTLESTTKIVEVEVNGARVPARVWEGTTASGIRCHAFITRIMVHKDDNAEEFDRELQECTPPTPAVDRAYNARLVL